MTVQGQRGLDWDTRLATHADPSPTFPVPSDPADAEREAPSGACAPGGTGCPSVRCQLKDTEAASPEPAGMGSERGPGGADTARAPDAAPARPAFAAEPRDPPRGAAAPS